MPCTHAAYLRAAAECRTPCDAVALAADPSLGLSYEALLSICAARLVAATKASMGRHRAKAAAITQRYEGGAHLVAIASELDLPPTMLARVVLEERYSLRKGAKGRHGAGALLRSPSLIDDPRLRSEVAAAVASDAAYGPAARRLTGLQQELVLSQELRARGIPFLSEEQLRERGEAKTPDALLPVPLLVRGRQFASYVNRYASGLVLYWFGFDEAIDDSDDLVLLDAFPDDCELMSHCALLTAPALAR
ncbi:hypothetical protein EMIHUDRAFT_223939 [Emiliania huxleyi CCMP1516]|uniref:CDAN1-interacting nuclease 1 n=2 Tax=Emiliania huxleyi TaxID=2903 RepID=A0A0D3KTH8_EMIH1|nr:hypothetical protein EMIHUDRAFT_223939 [Emiliania huxleyi CCMP1516]EOD39063.1 hypothetical protein EMIHUDRAFT_223939 [Emiliania huxleyi CCMP1516]|eukprot:XP_005791492.1 hypothetical protein EMIHUDRAFT_223939 [Emiliania huxleyi CCMP1516]